MDLRALKQATPSYGRRLFNDCAAFYQHKNVIVSDKWIQRVLSGGATGTRSPKRKNQHPALSHNKHARKRSRNRSFDDTESSFESETTTAGSSFDSESTTDGSSSSSEDSDMEILGDVGRDNTRKAIIHVQKQDDGSVKVTGESVYYTVHDVEGDGFCFYYSVVVGLEREKLFNKLLKLPDDLLVQYRKDNKLKQSKQCKRLKVYRLIYTLLDVYAKLENKSGALSKTYKHLTTQAKNMANAKIEIKANNLERDYWGSDDLLVLLAYYFRNGRLMFLSVGPENFTTMHYLPSKKDVVRLSNQYPAIKKPYKYVAVYNPTGLHFQNLEVISS